MIEIIDNFFTADDLNVLISEVEKGQWQLHGSSVKKPYNPVFWFKDIIDTKATSLFAASIQRGIGHKIIIDRLYVNGQAHGQCGDWHTDVEPKSLNCFTIVYFFKKWQPEYGGHLLIKTDPVTSILPEYNKAVLFDSTIEHMGMEPTVHCKTQRESIACKFRVL
jgi:hypothetical protein